MFYLTSSFLLSSYILYLIDYFLLWDVYVLSHASPSYLKANLSYLTGQPFISILCILSQEFFSYLS